jgi:hypothetical protein
MTERSAKRLAKRSVKSSWKLGVGLELACLGKDFDIIGGILQWRDSILQEEISFSSTYWIGRYLAP